MSKAKAPQNRKGNPTGKELDLYEHVEAEVDADVCVPPLPSYLSDLPGTSQLWSAVWTAGGVAYTAADTHIIERYVHLQGMRNDLIVRLGGEYLTAGSRGNVVLNPMHRRLSDIESKLNPLEDRLGLSPEARARLGLKAAKIKTGLEEFFGDDDDASDSGHGSLISSTE